MLNKNDYNDKKNKNNNDYLWNILFSLLYSESCVVFISIPALITWQQVISAT